MGARLCNSALVFLPWQLITILPVAVVCLATRESIRSSFFFLEGVGGLFLQLHFNIYSWYYLCHSGQPDLVWKPEVLHTQVYRSRSENESDVHVEAVKDVRSYISLMSKYPPTWALLRVFLSPEIFWLFLYFFQVLFFCESFLAQQIPT